jgi:hypothetical protein
MLCTAMAAHLLISVILTNVILPTSTKFHAVERFCELYAGRLEKKQLINDVLQRAGNESV